MTKHTRWSPFTRDVPLAVVPYFRESIVLGFFQMLVWVFWWTSFIEFLKLFFIWRAKPNLGCKQKETNLDCSDDMLCEKCKDHIFAARSTAIDLYMVLKWSVILLFIACKCDHWIALLIGIYLLHSNLFSYFYYHIWHTPSPRKSKNQYKTQRRFVAFFLSLLFSFVAYAYLFQFHFVNEINWPMENVRFFDALYVSLANAFTLTYGDVKPDSGLGRGIFISQVLYTFVFVVIIITESLPKK